jgi:hypothetical protein
MMLMNAPQRDPEALDAVIFPGGAPSRRARAERGAPPPETPAIPEPSWDDHPQIKYLRGEEREMFPVGALAAALGVTTKAIYKWERLRILPPSRYRTQAPKASPIPEKTPAGRRLYTRAQIEAVIEAAHEAYVSMPRRPGTHPDWKLFTALVVRSWKALG